MSLSSSIDFQRGGPLVELAKGRPVREVLEGGRLKGGMLRSHLRWLQEHHPDDVDRILGTLPADLSREIGAVLLVSSWYPFATLIHFDRAIAGAFGGDETLRELGRHSARINLSTTYKALDRDTNHDFFEHSALVHRQFQDFGTVAYERGAGGGRIVHSDYPCFSRIFCASAIGYYEATIKSHGAQRAQVQETECQCFGDRSCTFEMRWY
ncbi:MAG TPA: hypothetical protein VMT00_12820 [Thermoanaerobaculia bacterium]|nr:hypothetical protein [Thermoanaerobaculia bacterium]